MFRQCVSADKGIASPLGIIVKEITQYSDMSDGFLSKWIVEQAGEIFCLRDMTKAVNVKVYYHRDQRIFH